MIELLGYLNPFTKDTLTQLSLYIIIIAFTAAIFYLIDAFIKYKNVFNQDASEILKNKKVAKVVREFEAGLFEVEGKKKSFISFHKKISQEAILNHFFNDSILSSIGNILVGLGVLGTFLGLSKGVSGFVMENTDTIKTSINSLLGGMGTAFVSSIYGMLFSLIFITIYQFIKHTIFKKLDAFYIAMDDKYLATEAEIEAYKNKGQIQNIKLVIEEYFVNYQSDERITPKDYFHKLLQASEAQRISLGNLAEDLALTMQDLMDQLLKTSSEQFKSIIEDKLVPVLEELKAQKEESAGDIIQQVIERLESSMKEMLSEFKNSISGEAKGEMENLAKQLGGLAESLKVLPAEIKSVSSSVSENMSTLTKTVNTIIENINKSQEESEEKRKNVQDEAAKNLQNMLKSMGGNMQDLINSQSQGAEKLNILIAQIDSVVDKNNNSINSLDNLLTNSKNLFEKLNDSSISLTQATKSLQIGAKAVEDNNTMIKDTVNDFVIKNNQSIEKLINIQDEITKKTKLFLDDFGKFENGIEKVFESFNTGLINYSDQLENSLQKTAGSYIDKSSAAIEAISELTKELSEGVESLTDVLTKNR
jgi:hypothetical protein